MAQAGPGSELVPTHTANSQHSSSQTHCCTRVRNPAGSSGSPAKATAPAPVDAIKHQNYERADQGLQRIVLHALKLFAKDLIAAYHTSLLAKETTAADGSRATLGEMPACTTHTRTPEDTCDAPKVNELLACPSCKPWIEALGAAHDSKKTRSLNVSHNSSCRSIVEAWFVSHLSKHSSVPQPVSWHMARHCTRPMAHSHSLCACWVHQDHGGG